MVEQFPDPDYDPWLGEREADIERRAVMAAA
jgi:hypothetical protein